MSLTVELSNACEWTDEQVEPLFAEAFPAFISADLAKRSRVRRKQHDTLDIASEIRRGSKGCEVLDIAVRCSGHIAPKVSLRIYKPTLKQSGRGRRATARTLRCRAIRRL
jgi:hypothetical protein